MPFEMLKVDLCENSIDTFSAVQEHEDKYLGGSGLAFRIIADGDLDVEPLDPRCPLILMAGLLTGTPVPTACKGSAVSRSPQTGLWSESTFGGYWPRALRGAGFDGIMVLGRSGEPAYLLVTPEGAELRAASHLWGLDTFQATDALQGEHGPDARVLAIGPAGENLVSYASIIAGGHNARAAGRTGMGAVMGSKNLKAVVVVAGDASPSVHDPDEMKKITRSLMPGLLEGTELLREFGTAGGVQTVEHTGDLPIKNWYEGNWKEGAARICGQAMSAQFLDSHYACYGCPIRCGKEMRVPGGRHAGTVSHGPEYETCAAFGSMVFNDDPEILVIANDLANRLGLDTISAGAAIAFAMECSEKGLIDEDLGWGDGQVLLSLLDDIAAREGLGETLAGGAREAARRIGGRAMEYVVDVKGLDIAFHDPRAYYSMAVNYATGNRGGCHLEGLTYFVEGGSFAGEKIGMSQDWDSDGTDGRAQLTAAMQNYLGTLNALGLCKFLLRGGVGPKEVAGWYSAVTGASIDGNDLIAIGERIFNLKRLVNATVGVSRRWDTLPPRLLSHPRPSGGARGNLPHLGKMLHEYYEERGWTEEGLPTTGTLERLNLTDLPSVKGGHQ